MPYTANIKRGFVGSDGRVFWTQSHWTRFGAEVIRLYGQVKVGDVYPSPRKIFAAAMKVIPPSLKRKSGSVWTSLNREDSPLSRFFAEHGFVLPTNGDMRQPNEVPPVKAFKVTVDKTTKGPSYEEIEAERGRRAMAATAAVEVVPAPLKKVGGSTQSDFDARQSDTSSVDLKEVLARLDTLQAAVLASQTSRHEPVILNPNDLIREILDHELRMAHMLDKFQKFVVKHWGLSEEPIFDSEIGEIKSLRKRLKLEMDIPTPQVEVKPNPLSLGEQIDRILLQKNGHALLSGHDGKRVALYGGLPSVAAYVQRQMTGVQVYACKDVLQVIGQTDLVVCLQKHTHRMEWADLNRHFQDKIIWIEPGTEDSVISRIKNYFNLA